eukprot:g784.t1
MGRCKRCLKSSCKCCGSCICKCLCKLCKFPPSCVRRCPSCIRDRCCAQLEGPVVESKDGSDADAPKKGDYAESVEGVRDGRASLGADGVWRFETLKGRQCNDVACLIIFVMCWATSALITSQAFRKGDPARLVYATDFKGDVCGVGPESASRYIYYPALHTSLIPIGRCLPKCPVSKQKVCVPVTLFGRTVEHCDILSSNSSSFMYRCLRFTQYKKLLTVQCQAFGANTGPAPPPAPPAVPTPAPTPAPPPCSSLTQAACQQWLHCQWVADIGECWDTGRLRCPQNGGTVDASSGALFSGTLAGTNATRLASGDGWLVGAVLVSGSYTGSLEPVGDLVTAESILDFTDELGLDAQPQSLMKFQGRFRGGFTGVLSFDVTGSNMSITGDPLVITRLRGTAALADSAAAARPATVADADEATYSVDYTNCQHYVREWPQDAAALGSSPCSSLGSFRKIRCGGADADATDAATKARCEVALLRVYPHCTEHQLELGTYTDESVNQHPIYIALTAGADSILLYIGELQKAGSLLFIIGGLLSAAISLVWLLNVQRIGPKIVEVVVKLACLTLLLVLMAFAIIFFSLAGTIEVQAVNSVLGISHDEGDSLIGLQDAADAGAKSDYEALGWTFTILSVLAAAMIAGMWEKIEISIEIIKTAAKTLRSMPLVPFFPAVATSAMALALVYWLVGISYIVSVPDPESNNATAIVGAALRRAAIAQLQPNATQAQVTITAQQVDSWFTSNGTNSAGAISDRLRPERFSQDLLHGNVVWDLEMKAFCVFWVTLVSWWTTEVLRAIGVCTVAGATSKWYWYKEGQTREGHMFPIWGSFKRVIKYHFGSMVFGAAILRVAQIWLWALAYLTEQLRRLDTGGALGKVSKVVRCCLKCVVACLEGFIKYLTASAYVIIAIQGGNFCGATKRAFVLMRSQIRLGLMTEFAGGVLISLITLTIALVCACISYLILRFSSEIPNWFFEQMGLTDVTDIQHYVLPVLITGLFAYQVSEAFFDVLQTAIDTVFICYCADLKLNQKGGKLARNMRTFEEIKQADAEAHGDDDEKRIRVERARARARAAQASEAKQEADEAREEQRQKQAGAPPGEKGAQKQPVVAKATERKEASWGALAAERPAQGGKKGGKKMLI